MIDPLAFALGITLWLLIVLRMHTESRVQEQHGWPTSPARRENPDARHINFDDPHDADPATDNPRLLMRIMFLLLLTLAMIAQLIAEIVR